MDEISYTITDIRRAMGNAVYARGEQYVMTGKVLNHQRNGDFITGQVKGNDRDFYEQRVTFSPGTYEGQTKISGNCTCPVRYNCKHIAAVLIAYFKTLPPKIPLKQAALTTSTGLSIAVDAWLNRLENFFTQPSHTSINKKTVDYRFMFTLAPESSGSPTKLVLYPCKIRLNKNNTIHSINEVYNIQTILRAPRSYLVAKDKDMMELYLAHCAQDYSSYSCILRGKMGAQLLQMMLSENCLLLSKNKQFLGTHFLTLGPTRTAQLAWVSVENTPQAPDSKRLQWQFEDTVQPIPALLETHPPFYVDQHYCGELIFSTPIGTDSFEYFATLQSLIADCPALDVTTQPIVSSQLIQKGMEACVPLPIEIAQVTRDDCLPRPILVLKSLSTVPTRDAIVDITTDTATLYFDYDGTRVLSDFSPHFRRPSSIVPDATERILRQAVAEQAYVDTVCGYGFQKDHSYAAVYVFRSYDDWRHFAQVGRQELVDAGWTIEEDFNAHVFTTETIDDWYANVDSDSFPGQAWFNLELGIVLGEERLSLLPILIDLIRHTPHDFDPSAIAQHADDHPLLITLLDGRRIGLTWGRIKPILNILGELYFADKAISSSALRLSYLDAARLAELETALQCRWVGGERLLQMGKKLHTFCSIVKQDPPANLQTTLRDYQCQGLAWLQFLREYDLGGILADDMGLGKTIQTLAHLLLEKNAGRLTAPALVIAPTSLIHNWASEAARFAPDLRVLILHGIDRQSRFEQIPYVDLIFTTYALLSRDEKYLREKEFSFLILDEAHYIKNARAKSTKIVGSLPAKHRLCLTGTPLENHLGELWSQFHFLLPGLLGDEKTFNRDFKIPIEKRGDNTRLALLSRRIKPFLLRRTKDKVAKELPPKTEVVREIELVGAQCDLYETVRLAMDKKVRNAIASKGIARSHIIILEALLKLRQVCCDPRLVNMMEEKADKKKMSVPSAKLITLMRMLEALREENRRILVFSQFTSMLRLIEMELNKKKITYALLTGRTVDRATPIQSFQKGEVSIFLISLKAGGVGLNLTAADTVIHYDPWWNPAAENQATDRTWRIGQINPVFVYKLIAKHTVEEKIQQLQQKKSALASAILDTDTVMGGLALTQDDLQAIFEPLQKQ